MIAAPEIALLLALAVLAAMIVAFRHGCALFFGGALIVVAVLLSVGPLALVWLGVWIMEIAARGRRRGNNPMSRPYRGEEP